METEAESLAPNQVEGAWRWWLYDDEVFGYDRINAAASTGSVAPINVVGTSSTMPESRKRQRLKLKYPG